MTKKKGGSGNKSNSVNKSVSGKKASSNNSQRKKNSWGQSAVEVLLLLIWVGASVFASQYLIGYLMVWVLGVSAFDRPVVIAIYSALSYSLAMILIIFIPPKVLNKKRVTREDLGLKGLPTWTDIGLAPIGFVAYYLLAAGLLEIFDHFPWFIADEAQETGFSPFLVGTDRMIAFVVLVVIAPIVEEIIFRGWLYKKIKNA